MDNENTIQRPAALAAQVKKQFYDRLLALADAVEDDFEDGESETDKAQDMLAYIMEHGTYCDAAEAIRHFICYMHCLCDAG